MIELKVEDIIFKKKCGNLKILCFKYDETHELSFEAVNNALNVTIHDTVKDVDHFLTLSNFSERSLELVKSEMKKCFR